MKKKLFISVICVVVFIALVVVGLLIKAGNPPKVISLSQKGLPTEDVNLIAHRGFSAVAPENSDKAFIKAGEANFYAAECDIQLSKDNIWVVNHNDTIDYMTDGTGKISEMTYNEISESFIDKGNNWKVYAKQKLITLDDYLSICDEYKIIPQIEVKEGNYRCLDKILTALDNYDGMRENAIIISFDGVILEKIRNLDNEIELWYLTHEITDAQMQLAVMNNYALAFNCRKYDAETLKKAQDENIKLASWTVDDLKIYEELYNLGIRNFTTNRLTK